MHSLSDKPRRTLSSRWHHDVSDAGTSGSRQEWNALEGSKIWFNVPSPSRLTLARLSATLTRQTLLCKASCGPLKLFYFSFCISVCSITTLEHLSLYCSNLPTYVPNLPASSCLQRLSACRPFLFLHFCIPGFLLIYPQLFTFQTLLFAALT